MWILWRSLIALAGVMIGWLSTKILWQFPNRQNIFHAVKCNSCAARTKLLHQLPIIGYILSDGKCTECGKRTPLFVIILPIIMPILLVLLNIKFQFSLLFFQYSILTIAGILIFFLDLHHRIIPDIITLPMIVIAIIFSFFNDLGFWNALKRICIRSRNFHSCCFNFSAYYKNVDGIGWWRYKAYSHDRFVFRIQTHFFNNISQFR